MNKLLILTLITVSCLSLAAKLSVTQSSESRYKVVWETPSWNIVTDGDYSVIKVPDALYPLQIGAPLIPYSELKVAVPPMGSVQINIIRQIKSEIKLEKLIQPVPKIIYNEKTDAYLYQPDESLYLQTREPIVSVQDTQRFRNISFAPVRINPFVYDGKNSLVVITLLEFEIIITGNTVLKNALPMDELTGMISRQLINPQQAVYWQASEKSQIKYADFSKANFWVRIETDKDGMFKLTPAHLNMLPVNDIDPRNFRMFTTGGEVHPSTISYNGQEFRETPIFVAGENDGSFNSTDYILFYGRDRDGLEMNQNVGSSMFMNPYSKNAVYWLTFDYDSADNPLRITLSNPIATYDSVAVTSPETVRIENEAYRRSLTGFDWYMGKFFDNTNKEYLYSISLEDVDTAKNQTLSMSLIQEEISTGSTLWHKVRLKVNNQQLLNTNNLPQEWSWQGLNPITISHTGQHFVSGNNDILINVLRSGIDNLYFNYYQVLYQKKLIKRNKQFTVNVPTALAGKNIRYDFTGSSDVRVFKSTVTTSVYEVSELPISVVTDGFYYIDSGTTSSRFIVTQDSDYYAPASVQRINVIDLAKTSSTYNNLIITTSDFVQQAENLAYIYSSKWNKSSKIVQLQDIFNQFNGGMPDPNAIRLFLKHCVTSSSIPTLTSVTLVGSGTLDWRNYSGQAANKNKLIVYQKNTIITDDYFVLFNTEQYPELAIGRYPVKTVNDFSTMLSNLDKYINEPQPGIWRNSLIFLADDQFNGQAIGEYSHSQQLHETSVQINKSILIDKLYAIEYEFDEFQNKPQVRDEMMEAINAGKLIWYYIGHGSYDTLGAEDYFKGSLDMGRFDNTGKLPLFIAASCDVAQFDHYTFDSLAEKVLMLNNKGAIASIAATRECWGTANVEFLQRYYKYSLNLRNAMGYSIVRAKFEMSANSYNNERYVLLGDPLLLITTPERDSSIVIQTLSKDVTLKARETVTIQGQFPAQNINDIAQLQVFDTDIFKNMPINYIYTKRGRNLSKGNSTVTNSAYNAGFIVPDDVTNGNSGLILAYVWSSALGKDFVSYYAPVSYSDQPVPMANPDAPQIQLYLDNEDFTDGGVVGSNPLLIAKISDSNGINITNSPGHGIILILDQAAVTINVTDYFTYNTDSYQEGFITYQLSGLKEGGHQLQLLAFDNLNRPAVTSINFTVNKGKDLVISQFLPYPNPMKKSGYFTFTLSDAADVKLSIYTIRGRKIKTISATAVKGYNQLLWDGRDEDGDYLANNTYFIKLTAKALTVKAKAEKIEKLVIYN